MQEVQRGCSKASAVLFVHGAGGGSWEWNVWARVFAAEGFLVRALDLQAVAAGPARTQLADYSAQVRASVEALKRDPASDSGSIAADSPGGNDKIVLIGASLGGLLALMNADRADALILINPMPPAPLHAQMPERGDYPPVIAWGADASLEGTRQAMPDADEAACLYAFRHWRDESGMAMNAARAGVVVPKCGGPQLVVVSECDKDVPPAIGATLAQSLGADLQVVPNASHVGPLLGRTANILAERAVVWLNETAWNDRVQPDLTTRAPL